MIICELSLSIQAGRNLRLFSFEQLEGINAEFECYKGFITPGLLIDMNIGLMILLRRLKVYLH